MLQRERSSQGAKALVSVPPPTSFVYRVARGPDPFRLVDDRGQANNRFDDPGSFRDPSGRRDTIPPQEQFSVLYCATQPACAFGETIARFRPSVETIAKLEAINDDAPVDPSLYSNAIPADWRFKRRIGRILLDRSLRFVDVNHAASITQLRTVLAPLIDMLGVADLDLSAISSQNRRLTQEVARYVYEQHDDCGNPLFAGVRYMSRLHHEWECWAIFHDRMTYHQQHTGTIFPDDPGLLEAARVLGLAPPDAF